MDVDGDHIRLEAKESVWRMFQNGEQVVSEGKIEIFEKKREIDVEGKEQTMNIQLKSNQKKLFSDLKKFCEVTIHTSTKPIGHERCSLAHL